MIFLERGFRQEYELNPEKRLGRGSFGEVYLALEKSTQIKKAIKIVDLYTLKKNGIDCTERIENEINLQPKLFHNNIVKMEKCFKEDHRIYMVLEYCENETLRKYVLQRRNDGNKTCLSEFKIASYTKQLLSAVAYLHRKMIVHRDLSDNNVLLTENYRTVKICDFGLSKQLDCSQNGAKTFAGTPNYMAPEIGSGNEYSTETDIYSLGCIFYFMFKGEVQSLYPKREEKHNRLIFQPADRVTVANALENIRPLISKKALDLMAKLLCVDPKQRVNALVAQRHPFLIDECVKQSVQSLDRHDSGIGVASSDRASVRTGTCQGSRSRGHDFFQRPSSAQPLKAYYPPNLVRPPSGCRAPQPPSQCSGAAVLTSITCEKSACGGVVVAAGASCCHHSRYDDNGLCLACRRAQSRDRVDVCIAKNPCVDCYRSASSCLCNQRRNNCWLRPIIAEMPMFAQIATKFEYKQLSTTSQCLAAPIVRSSPIPTREKVDAVNQNSSKKCETKRFCTRFITSRYRGKSKPKFRIEPDAPVTVTLADGRRFIISSDGSKMWKKNEEHSSTYHCDELPDDYKKIYRVADYLIERLKVSNEERIRFEEDVGIFTLMKNGNFRGLLFRAKKVDVTKEKLLNSSIVSIINELSQNFTESEMSTIKTVLRTCQEYVKQKMADSNDSPLGNSPKPCSSSKNEDKM
uniref:Protein kinase domain-containing protein n=1 Tax=Romanomermis culicivorax TaxID=13658 RepID=A0A915K1F9_ROMCU